MKQNKTYSASTEHKKAKWATRVAIVATALATAFGISDRTHTKKLSEAKEKEVQTQQATFAQISSLKRQLAQAQARAKKAEQLNERAWTVLEDAMPVYTAVGDGNEQENAKEEAKFKKNCKTMHIDPTKLQALYKDLRGY